MTRINGFVGRRNLLKLAGIGGAGIAASAVKSGLLLNGEEAKAQTTPTKTEKRPRPVSPDEALKKLLRGNERFVAGKRANPNQSQLRLLETSVAQYPYASILGCADSRVPAEIVFDQGLGDLFVVRVAGNVASQTAIGSLEFSSAVLGSQLIIVLGHAKCGAVIAAVKGDPLPGRIGIFVEEIKPAVESVRQKTGDLEKNSIIANIQYQVKKLPETSTILGNLVKEGKLKIVGGVYDLASGKVTLVT
ncbi:carbonic anhydrase [Dulcicalothrix desertica PCC 7102]|uniref:carbonic anhydrase n=1 Tax=Dulcicalothrix desertica PCC 7102 TaxID=232991 RepID=A0A433VV40_9CYAN|nr:carbonic anhydrase [Dulcicalothrix desertica]RUT09949.1 carbonic anhydrase [Dulcicalothrix desertica PCC 7102]TWH51141.1 carbonic anhydrase [Dulcicalothrix desertica PCC 7102]